MDFEIVEIAKYRDGLTEEETLASEKDGVVLLTNSDVDEILQNDEQRQKYKDYFPLRTGTHVELDGKSAIVKEAGETVKTEAPLEDGWHGQDKFGLPFGKKSNSADKAARYLWRLQKWSGLVVRGYDWLFDNYRRDVDCGGRPDYRFGVLGKRIYSDENTVEFKSVPENYAKEKDGRKPNTVRVEETGDPRFEKLRNGTAKFIRIKNTETGETFTRTITDKTFWNNEWIISWRVV